MYPSTQFMASPPTKPAALRTRAAGSQKKGPYTSCLKRTGSLDLTKPMTEHSVDRRVNGKKEN
jgi:hypothetical protein